MTAVPNIFSAAKQSLGYSYQPRLALLNAIDMPEADAIYIERCDDLEFVSPDGTHVLASLKHKAEGDQLTDLSTDFWKSVRIWLAHYTDSGLSLSNARFLLLTTSTISSSSFLVEFVRGQTDADKRLEKADELSEDERRDFYGRITIFHEGPRITDIPNLIDIRLRTIPKVARTSVFERLEGWWTDLVIRLLAGDRQAPVLVSEVIDKLVQIADEYRSDNLPITFRTRSPENIDTDNDPRVFVQQLRVLEISKERIQRAIIDYYRAFEQRSSWARENLLLSGEIESYEDRLIEEWARFREICHETIDEESHDELCLQAGKDLYDWAQRHTIMPRIRERVAEPYVITGSFHILANTTPVPRVFWHPRFLEKLAAILGRAA
jgi:hypothetical protein